MMKPHVLIKPSTTSTRILVTRGADEILKAELPAPAGIHHCAAPTLMEGLALWLQRPLSIVLCADAEGASCGLGLCDGFGFGMTSAHYDVEVVDTAKRRRLGSFRDLRRQLDLRGSR